MVLLNKSSSDSYSKFSIVSGVKYRIPELSLDYMKFCERQSRLLGGYDHSTDPSKSNSYITTETNEAIKFLNNRFNYYIFSINFKINILLVFFSFLDYLPL